MKTSKQPKHQNIATCAETLFVCILFSLFFYLSNGAKQSQLFIHHRDDNTVIVIQLQSNASILVHPLDSQHSWKRTILFHGWTPLHYASRFCHHEWANALLKCKEIEINVHNPIRHTSLHLATLKSHSEYVTRLLAHTNIAPNLTDHNDGTVFHMLHGLVILNASELCLHILRLISTWKTIGTGHHYITQHIMNITHVHNHS